MFSLYYGTIVFIIKPLYNVKTEATVTKYMKCNTLFKCKILSDSLFANQTGLKIAYQFIIFFLRNFLLKTCVYKDLLKRINCL